MLRNHETIDFKPREFRKERRLFIVAKAPEKGGSTRVQETPKGRPKIMAANNEYLRWRRRPSDLNAKEENICRTEKP